MTDRGVALTGPLVPKAVMTKKHAGERVKDCAEAVKRPFQISAKHLRPLSDARSHFTPAVDRHWLDDSFFGLWMTAITFAIVDAGGLIGVATIQGTNQAVALPILIAGQFGWLPISMLIRKRSQASKRNFNAFLVWLQSRYGITLNAKQGLPRYLNSEVSAWSKSFKDDTGRPLELVESPRGVYSVRLPDSEKELPNLGSVIEQPKFKALTKQPDVQLPRELKALFYQIEEHLQVLAGRKLSPESDHVVNRAARDRDAVMALVADLVRLQVSRFDAAQEASIKRTFTTLLSELQEVLRKETTFALDSLNIENSYVAAREVKPGIRLKKEIR